MEQLQTLQHALSLPLVQDRPREDSRSGDMDALRSMFIRNVSHELRTPLGIILGYVELLHDEHLGALQPEQARALSTVINSVHELHKIVERLGILMAIETNSSVPVPLSLAAVITQVVERERAHAHRAGLELIMCVEQDLPLVSGDPHHLEHVVESLVENALKFTPCGGRVEVEVYGEPDWVCLAVTDTGIGIPAQELQRIFSGFYQVDGSASRKYGGLGLGLTLVKAVVEEHGGTIEVESQPDRGSRFLVRLPARRMTDTWIGQLKRWRDRVLSPLGPSLPSTALAPC